ncbi:cobalamin biosynthesis protein [Methanobrevibacter arboriphilus JCM 13429 = DSM 1125]|uniref:Probable cobalamin biosynthesis protein CobD n=1 Tax=Methanobrevibacter arboriphilus JCM 13429 = DSM 1125 TaxID=1300164 RepID=A0A1V6N278_METAZ|nr:cobalamin biosynthesis protein [Methanobrevibacter arboriphilus]OQD58606.1 cobalamin biosynthesis protein [Methanobrevibacter arboriphilus JCM 13429 = DSM 1125]
MYFQDIPSLQFFTLISLGILIFSILFDILLGELPTKIHPVVFIGKNIEFFLKYLIKIKNKISGFILTILVSLIVILFFIVILLISSYNLIIFLIISSLILSSTFSIRMLLSSAKSIFNDLELDINSARVSMSHLVSRDTSELTKTLIVSATIETLSENITDSVISPVFYYIIANIIFILALSLIVVFNFSSANINILNIIIFSVIIAIFYRIINTLDAMVGYKNEKYSNIGYFPAKLDDILNYIPARLGGILTVLTSFLYRNQGFNYKNSYLTMLNDARKCPSPNSGFTMAAVAGALDISLTKKNVYSIGKDKNVLKKNDINKAIKLSKLTIFLSILFLILIFLIFILIIFVFLL